MSKTEDKCKNCKTLTDSGKQSMYIFSLWHYNKDIQKVFLLYKKQGIHIFAQYFAEQLIPLIKKIIKNRTVYFVVIEPNVQNKKTLGFNSTGYIVNIIRTYIPCVYLKNVFTRKKSPSQKNLSSIQRFTNVQDSTYIKKTTQKKLKRKIANYNKSEFFLFDDVVTTGASMQVCYQKLKRILPDSTIYGLSLCRVDGKNKI